MGNIVGSQGTGFFPDDKVALTSVNIPVEGTEFSSDGAATSAKHEALHWAWSVLLA